MISLGSAGQYSGCSILDQLKHLYGISWTAKVVKPTINERLEQFFIVGLGQDTSYFCYVSLMNDSPGDLFVMDKSWLKITPTFLTVELEAKAILSIL